jgi:murein DD-endopeptidase MepM/ murein hydrolase activator NlpD
MAHKKYRVVGCVMGTIASGQNYRLALRLAVAGFLASLLAGCADSERLSDPFSNPFRSSSRVDSTPTASYSMPTSPVQSRPLPPAVTARPADKPSAAYSAPAHPSPSFASAQPTPTPDMTSSVSRGQKVTGWTAEGGTPVVVAQGETAEAIARRYGIPPDALLRVNGFSASNQVYPGTRLVIPVYNAALAVSSGARVADHAAHPEHVAEHAPRTEKEKPAATEKLAFLKGPKPVDKAESKTAKTASKKAIAEAKAEDKAQRAKEAKEAKGLDHAKSKLARSEKIEPARIESAKMEGAKIEKVKLGNDTKVAVKDIVKPAVERGTIVAKAETLASEPKKTLVDPTPTASLPSDAPEFRWPARGRIIQAFKTGSNDGINIALPEGTSVKAAESGVVVYSGSELKGYGNLVLIKHPNGFVSAYANNGDIEVKRGETVKRGQVIAKSGQSGNVASPQLHFELRKGSTPVDPTQYLAGL